MRKKRKKEKRERKDKYSFFLFSPHMAGKNETTTDKLFLKRKKFRNCRNEVQDLTLKFDKIFQLHS